MLAVADRYAVGVKRGGVILSVLALLVAAPNAGATRDSRALHHEQAQIHAERRATSHAERTAALAVHVRLVDTSGRPLGGELQQWADQAKVATGDYSLIITTDGECDPAQSVTQGAVKAPGCSWSGLDGLNPPGTPSQTSLDTTDYAPAFVRSTLMFELGHQFDWNELTNRDRTYLARQWGVSHWPWLDTLAGLAAGHEDGLEGVFASIYAFCAEFGGSDKGSETLLWESGQHPTAKPRINDCAYIDRVALAHQHP